MFKTHGMSDGKLYGIWRQILNRCTKPNTKQFGDYGGRGIIVCDEWRHDFQAFYDHISQLPNFGEKDYTLDRIDNEGNYEPGNMRFATRIEQSRNRRNVRMFTCEGETKCLSQWSRDIGVPIGTLHRWLKLGMSMEQVLHKITLSD